MTTVDRIFQIIEDNNLTAKEFAQNTGLSQGNITDWKTGRAKPSTEALVKISNAYNVSIDYLLCRSNLKIPVKQYSDFILLHILNFLYHKYDSDIKKLGLTEVQIDILKNSVQDYFLNDRQTMYSDDFNKMLKSLRNSEDIKNFYMFFIRKVMSMNFSAYKKLPFMANEGNIVKNYYIDLDDEYFKAEKNMNLDKEEYDFIEKIMNIANSKYIDGPIYKRKTNIKNNNYISSNYYMCPVYGQISAGQPNWAEECIEGYLPIDPNLMGIINPEEHFFLRVNRRKYE